MAYTDSQKWSMLHSIDQLDTKYFGLVNDRRHTEAANLRQGQNLIEQNIGYNASVACTFLDLIDRRDDSIRNHDPIAYYHIDEAVNLLRSIYPQLPADEPACPALAATEPKAGLPPDFAPLPF